MFSRFNDIVTLVMIRATNQLLLRIIPPRALN